MPSTRGVKLYIADLREFLQAGMNHERKTLIRNFFKGGKVNRDEVSIQYSNSIPSDGATQDQQRALDQLA